MAAPLSQDEFEGILEKWAQGDIIVDEYNNIRHKTRPVAKDVKALLKVAHNTPTIRIFAKILVTWWASGDDRLLLCMFDNDSYKIDANMRNTLNDWERRMPDAIDLFVDEGFVKEECLISIMALINKAKNKAKAEKLIAISLKNVQL